MSDAATTGTTTNTTTAGAPPAAPVVSVRGVFKTFEAEAFVIPTGSMAPTLMGRHKDVICPQCGYRYSASGSEEADRDGNLRRLPTGEVDERWQVVECTCPNCRFPMSVDPRDAQGSVAQGG